ncbi:MAG: hypothetical protein R3B48_15695 [Kofleriaceae bacterium]
MSHNVGGIYVRLKRGVTAARVRRELTSYFTERGATAIEPPTTIETLALEKTGQLVLALVSTGGWLGIADSERYHASFGLARHLASALATRCVWYTLYGATDAGIARAFGPGKRAEMPDDEYGAVEDFVQSSFPLPCLYFDQLDHDADLERVAFEGVTEESYDRGPVPDEDEDEDDEDDEEADDEDREDGGPAARELARWPIELDRELVAADELRLDLVVVFFLSNVFAKHVAAVSKVFDHWLSLVPAEMLRWAKIGSNATSSKAVNKQTLGKCRAQLTAKAAAKFAAFELGGPNANHPAYQFFASGSACDADDVERGSASAVGAYFPWSTPVETLVAFADFAAKMLTYTTGFVTPILRFDGDTVGAAARTPAARLAVRYPGLELGFDGFELGDRCHGAHWLTYLGPRQVAALQLGTDELAAAGVRTYAAGAGLCLRASEAPELGDALRDELPGGMCAIATRVASITAAPPDTPRRAGPRTTIELVDGFGPAFEQFQAELGARWCDRWLGDGRELAAAAHKLAALEQLERDARALAERGLDRDADEALPVLEALATVPYLSRPLVLQLLHLARHLLTHGRPIPAALEEALSIEHVLRALNYDRWFDTLTDASQAQPVLEWLFRRCAATPVEKSLLTMLGSVGAAAIARVPAVAPLVFAAMPETASQYHWDALLYSVNNQLGAWCRSDPALAEQVSDAVQPVAHHNPPMYLWTATIYLARGRADDAMTQLELAFQHGYRDLARVKGDADFAPLLRTPRFAALAAAYGKPAKRR